MTSRSFSLIGGRVARFTRLDGCGRIAYGDDARLITEGFISVKASAQIDEGSPVSVTNANGRECARRSARPKHNGYGVEVVFCGVDPEAVNFTTAQPVVENGVGDIAGFDVDTELDGSTTGWALEIWTEVGEGEEACSPTDEHSGYVVFPFLKGGQVGDFEVTNDAINFTVTGATSRKGHAWGTGPYLVDTDESGDPTALAVIPPSVALRVVEVGLTPPAESGGAIPLDDPDAAEATGATAGTPGVFTPSGSFRPEVVDDMDAVTAAPSTAWTTGQYVTLQSGAKAHWTGTAWADGPAA